MSNIKKRDKWGRPLNEKGQIIDKFGRPIFDENGNMIPYPEARFYMDPGAKKGEPVELTEEGINQTIEHMKKIIKDPDELSDVIEKLKTGAKEANRRHGFTKD